MKPLLLKRHSPFLLAMLVLGASALRAQSVEIIGHRGASYDAPENTLSSMRMGWEHGADGVELDIHLSKDGQIVVLHDDSTKRIGGVDRKVAEQTFEELRRLDMGSWKGERFAGEKMPTLDEALATIPADPNKRLFIEIKCGAEVIPALKASLERSGKPARQCVIIGFSYETMRAAKQALPQYEMYLLQSFKQNKTTNEWIPSADELVRQTKEAGLEGVDVNGKGPVDAAFIARVKAAGLKCYVWTVDSPVQARQLVADGIDGITTNRSLWLRDQLQIQPEVAGTKTP